MAAWMPKRPENATHAMSVELLGQDLVGRVGIDPEALGEMRRRSFS